MSLYSNQVRHVLHQVQSKLGLSGASNSLPKVLEKWPSKDLAGVKNIPTTNNKMGQTGLALDMNALQQNLERFPATRNNLEHTVPINSNPSVPPQPPEEQESINLSNLGPAASPGSSAASSAMSSPGGSRIGSLKSDNVSVGTDSLPPILSRDGFKGDEGDGNHVLDIPPANDSLSGPPSFQSASNRSEPSTMKTRALGTRPLHAISNEPSTIVRIVDQAIIEDPRALHEQIDRSAKADSESTLPLHAVGDQPGSLRPPQEVVAPAPISSAPRPPSEARPSTWNATAKKPAAGRLGPNNALAGIRILLAEDTPVLAKVATIMLEKMGARVFAVADGLQAVETIGKSRGDQSVLDGEEPNIPLEEQFDLVLMDCQVNQTEWALFVM